MNENIAENEIPNLSEDDIANGPFKRITDDLDDLLEVLPPHIRVVLKEEEERENLLEVVLDLGRTPEARLLDREIILSDQDVTAEDIDYVVSRIGDFNDDNRAGIERTLHRISAIRNRKGRIVGLTCRVGRAVYGTIDIVRDIVESGRSILLLGKPGVGKCVTGDALVLTDRGLQPLADLIPDNMDADEFKSITLMVVGRDGLEPASQVYCGGPAETIEITTRQGFTLQGTHEHPVLALTETGELAFRQLAELETSDYLAIQRGPQCFGDEIHLASFDFIPRTNALDNPLPTTLTADLARFLGYIVAEGTLSFDNQVTFSNADPDVQADMARLTEQLFGLRLRKHLYQGQWNGWDFRIFGVKLRRFLLHLGLAQGRAAEKSIPPCILAAPRPIVTEFLRALFEGDGSVYGQPGRIEFASASRTLMSQVHIMLLNYGIVGNLRTKHNKKYDHDYYYLTLLGHSVILFAKQIGFTSAAKRAKLEQAVAALHETKRNPNLDVIPHQTARLRQLRTRIGKVSSTFARFTRADQRAPSYRTLRLILDEAREAADEPAYQILSELYDQHFYFDTVKHIETGEAYVYDLSVPGTHSFFANGFVSHNTTMLRETARVLAERKRVVIVDTSNEIAGDGDIPHPAIGRARRMQVVTPALQHAVMIEAVENHMPEVIVIDEIGTELEAAAARTIAERGVQLVGTAHGNTMDNVMLNPTLADLVGGIQAVILSDEVARQRGTQKTVLERKAPPTFDVVVEILDWDRLAVHHDVAEAVDGILRGRPIAAEIRYRDVDTGQVITERAELPPDTMADEGPRYPQTPPPEPTAPRRRVRIYSFGVSQNRLEQAAHDLAVPVTVVRDLEHTDVLLTSRAYYRKRPKTIRIAEARGTPIYVLRSNTQLQMEHFLTDYFGLEARPDPVALALQEAEEAIAQVLAGSRPVELTPQNAYIRRLQHQLAEQYNVNSRSRGKEPKRRVKIFPQEGDTQ